uniref:Uncharacterized protein n=1 Tax=Vitis vinifera TaxID=29760 RepID=F6I2L8_VITVI
MPKPSEPLVCFQYDVNISPQFGA